MVNPHHFANTRFPSDGHQEVESIKDRGNSPGNELRVAGGAPALTAEVATRICASFVLVGDDPRATVRRGMFIIVALALLAAACSGTTYTTTTQTIDPGATTTPASTTTSTTSAAAASTTTADASNAGTTLVTATTGLGTFLVDDAGNTLYLFVPDSQGDSTCYDACAGNWPPLTGDVSAGAGVDATLLGTTARTDGTVQVTYNGWPLYYFVADWRITFTTASYATTRPGLPVIEGPASRSTQSRR
jgi:predicted lipoprotein with Yx(FWY)xxD motif